MSTPATPTPLGCKVSVCIFYSSSSTKGTFILLVFHIFLSFKDPVSDRPVLRPTIQNVRWKHILIFKLRVNFKPKIKFPTAIEVQFLLKIIFYKTNLPDQFPPLLSSWPAVSTSHGLSVKILSTDKLADRLKNATNIETFTQKQKLPFIRMSKAITPSGALFKNFAAQWSEYASWPIQKPKTPAPATRLHFTICLGILSNMFMFKNPKSYKVWLPKPKHSERGRER